MEEAQFDTERRQNGIAKALQNLEDASVTFADLCLYVFNPDNCYITTGWRWNNFYKKPEDVDQILTWMVSKPNSKQARKFVKRGMIKIVEDVVVDEANQITKAGVLRPPAEIDPSYVLGMKFSELPQTIQVNCPTIYRILIGIAKTCRQERECTPVRLQHKSLVSAAPLLLAYMLTYRISQLVAISATTLLGERSQLNSYLQHILGMYLYSSGIGRQPITVLNRLGLSVSWPTLAGAGKKQVGTLEEVTETISASETKTLTKGPQEPTLSPAQGNPPKKLVRNAGTLARLSISMRQATQRIAATQPLLLIYDNINMLWKVAEQIIGRTGEHQS